MEFESGGIITSTSNSHEDRSRGQTSVETGFSERPPSPGASIAEEAMFVKTRTMAEVIRKCDGEAGWCLYAKSTGKRLGGPYDTRDEAVEREREVQFFKHQESYIPQVGETVWAVVDYPGQLVQGTARSVTSIDNKPGNTYVDLLVGGTQYHVPANLVFKQRPRQVEKVDQYGTIMVWESDQLSEAGMTGRKQEVALDVHVGDRVRVIRVAFPDSPRHTQYVGMVGEVTNIVKSRGEARVIFPDGSVRYSSLGNLEVVNGVRAALGGQGNGATCREQVPGMGEMTAQEYLAWAYLERPREYRGIEIALQRDWVTSDERHPRHWWTDMGSDSASFMTSRRAEEAHWYAMDAKGQTISRVRAGTEPEARQSFYERMPLVQYGNWQAGGFHVELFEAPRPSMRMDGRTSRPTRAAPSNTITPADPAFWPTLSIWHDAMRTIHVQCGTDGSVTAHSWTPIAGSGIQAQFPDRSEYTVPISQISKVVLIEVSRSVKERSRPVQESVAWRQSAGGFRADLPGGVMLFVLQKPTGEWAFDSADRYDAFRKPLGVGGAGFPDAESAKSAAETRAGRAGLLAARLVGETISSDDYDRIGDASDKELAQQFEPVTDDAGQFPPKEEGEKEEATMCVCPSCGARLERETDATPCGELKCPKCGAQMMTEGQGQEEARHHLQAHIHRCHGCGKTLRTPDSRAGGKNRPPPGWAWYVERGTFQHKYCDDCIAAGKTRGVRMAPYKYYEKPYGRYREVSQEHSALTEVNSSRMTFTQIADPRFVFGLGDFEAGSLSSSQWAELERVLEDRRRKIERNLKALPGVSVEVDRPQRVGSLVGQVRQKYIVTKVGRQTTWNAVYQAVNSVHAVPYDKLGPYHATVASRRIRAARRTREAFVETSPGVAVWDGGDQFVAEAKLHREGRWGVWLYEGLNRDLVDSTFSHPETAHGLISLYDATRWVADRIPKTILTARRTREVQMNIVAWHDTRGDIPVREQGDFGRWLKAQHKAEDIFGHQRPALEWDSLYREYKDAVESGSWSPLWKGYGYPVPWQAAGSPHPRHHRAFHEAGETVSAGDPWFRNWLTNWQGQMVRFDYISGESRTTGDWSLVGDTVVMQIPGQAPANVQLYLIGQATLLEARPLHTTTYRPSREQKGVGGPPWTVQNVSLAINRTVQLKDGRRVHGTLAGRWQFRDPDTWALIEEYDAAVHAASWLNQWQAVVVEARHRRSVKYTASWHVHEKRGGYGGSEFVVWYEDRGYPYDRREYRPGEEEIALSYIEELKAAGHVMARRDSTPGDYAELLDQRDFWAFGEARPVRETFDPVDAYNWFVGNVPEPSQSQPGKYSALDYAERYVFARGLSWLGVGEQYDIAEIAEKVLQKRFGTHGTVWEGRVMITPRPVGTVHQGDHVLVHLPDQGMREAHVVGRVLTKETIYPGAVLIFEGPPVGTRFQVAELGNRSAVFTKTGPGFALKDGSPVGADHSFGPDELIVVLNTMPEAAHPRYIAVRMADGGVKAIRPDRVHPAVTRPVQAVTREFRWEEEAVQAIRDHFTNRNAARGQQGRRVVLRPRLVEMLPSGDMVYSYTYGGETVTMTKKAYNCVVDFQAARVPARVGRRIHEVVGDLTVDEWLLQRPDVDKFNKERFLDHLDFYGMSGKHMVKAQWDYEYQVMPDQVMPITQRKFEKAGLATESHVRETPRPGDIVWFRGDEVELDGTKDIHYGGVFWNGRYLTGYRKGEPVSIADELLRHQPGAQTGVLESQLTREAGWMTFAEWFPTVGLAPGEPELFKNWLRDKKHHDTETFANSDQGWIVLLNQFYRQENIRSAVRTHEATTRSPILLKQVGNYAIVKEVRGRPRAVRAGSKAMGLLAAREVTRRLFPHPAPKVTRQIKT